MRNFFKTSKSNDTGKRKSSPLLTTPIPAPTTLTHSTSLQANSLKISTSRHISLEEDVDVNEPIQIKRSDGLKQDLNLVFAHPAISDVISTAHVTKDDPDHEHDHGRISINRSDGVTHDIIRVFNKYYTDASGDTLRVQANASTSQGQSRTLSVGKIDLSAFTCNTSTSSGKTASTANAGSNLGPGGDPVTPFYLKTVRIVHMSDTHNFLVSKNKHHFLPHGHILVHSGNFTKSGTDEEFEQFNDWLNSVKDLYHYRIVCFGNRDVKGYGNDWDSMRRLLPGATHVLSHNEATILGIRFYAAPWHWGHKTNYTLRSGAPGSTTGRFDDIPFGIHVLITHGPAYDRLDMTLASECKEHWGSQELLDALRKVRPGVHLHGHVKDGRGFLPAFGNMPLAVNSSMTDKDITVLYAAPHVIRADQLLLDPLKNVVDWSFAMDALDG
jgi:Icc-related predicted phosphoesterase